MLDTGVMIKIPLEVKERLWEVAKEIIKRKPDAKKGEVNNIHGRDRVIDMYEGLLGEWAVAQYLGVKPNTDVYDHKGDGNIDLHWKGYKIDAKASSMYRYPSLLVRTDRRMVCDLYIQCAIIDDYSVIEISGYAWKKELLKKRPQRVTENGPLNRVIRYNRLTPIDEILRLEGNGEQHSSSPL